jgi:type I restriction enzyme S subunit
LADRKFKDTEVGRIPVDWEVKRLGEIATITMGQSPSSTYYNTEFEGLPLIQGNADLVNRKTVQRIFTKQVTKRCKEGDIIVTVRAPVGKVGKATFDACIGRGVCAISYTNDYLYYYLMHIEEHWEKLSRGTTFDAVNSSDIQALLIPIPPLPEQKAIAKVLSDMDELIESIEKLIHKKKQIKQGAMQELLTGKKRLPGFSGEWEVKKFNNIFTKLSIKNHQIKSSFYLESGKYPVVDQGKKKVIAYTDNADKVFKCPESGVIVFGDHTRETKYIDFDFVVGADGVQVLRTNDEFLTLFYYYLLQTMDIPDSGYSRHFKYLLEMEYVAPPLPEQKAIAQILSDMDAEIEALEKKLDKYRKIKEGMMEKLLTGQVRLV